jgi:hypothetical protein
MAGGRETVVATPKCCDRFGGFPANGSYRVTLNGSNCISVEVNLSDLRITIPMNWRTQVLALATANGSVRPSETIDNSGVVASPLRGLRSLMCIKRGIPDISEFGNLSSCGEKDKVYHKLSAGRKWG